MLVLSRKEQETIRIGKDIVITITGIEGQRVSIGIEAPSDVKILRGELAERASSPVSADLSKVIQVDGKFYVRENLK